MVKVSKPDDVVEPAVEKASKKPAVPKVPLIDIPHSLGVRQLADRGGC